MGVWPDQIVPMRGESFLWPNEMELTAHGTLTQGMIVALDWATGSDGSGATTTKAVAAAEDEYGPIGVCKHAAASGARVVVVFRSPSVLATFSAVAVTRGGKLMSNGTNANLAAVTTNKRCVAVALESANGNTKRVFFNGVEGLGFKGS